MESMNSELEGAAVGVVRLEPFVPDVEEPTLLVALPKIPAPEDVGLLIAVPTRLEVGDVKLFVALAVGTTPVDVEVPPDTVESSVVDTAELEAADELLTERPAGVTGVRVTGVQPAGSVVKTA